MKDWRVMLQALNVMVMLNKITAQEFHNLKVSIFDTIDQKRMDDDTWFRTNGKVSGRKIIFY